jgi:hypothetical protein
MQFLLTVTVVEENGDPPDEFQTAMTNFVDEATSAGTFVLTGAPAPEPNGARLGTSKAGLVRRELQLPIHGYAVVECPALEQAMDIAARLLEVHHQFVPDWTVECDVREIVTHCLP